MRFPFAAAVGTAVLIATIGSASAHEGHDHEAKPPQVSASVGPRGEASSDAFELVAFARGTELLIYLDRFATNEPVDGATIGIETPQGPAAATVHAGNAYRLNAPWLAAPGRFDLIFTVTAGGTTDVLPLTLDTTGHSAPMGGQGAAPGAHQFLSDRAAGFIQPAILGAGLVGFLLGLIPVAVSRRRRRIAAAVILILLLSLGPRPGIAHEGEDHGDPKPAALPASSELAQRLPDGAIFVPKSIQRIFGLRTELTQSRPHRRSIELPGRIVPDTNASGYVQASIGGRLAPPPGGFPRLGTPVKRGDVLAYLTAPLQAIDVSTMRQQQGDLDQQISIVERRLARYETLAPNGAVPRSQLEDTRLELQGLKQRRASLDNVPREPEALVTPVSGVVADGAPVAGQIAQPNAVIFHIVDPLRLWIEALSFESIVGTEDASAVTSNGKKLSLAHRGSGFADRSQSIPIHFAIEDDVAGLRVGQFVTVLVTTNDQKQGIAIPRTSLVRGTNGQDFVFEHVNAERFMPRPVRVEPLDGDRVLVLAGLVPATRVVVQGAELLDHVR
jgi:multidrug efflux pump subunit AcrA (membrane-fusion protein)